MNPYHIGKSLSDPGYLDDLVSRFVTERRVCVQAGGHKGAWPRFLSRYFDTVITVEPFYENFVDLAGGELPDNVYPIRAGLWSETGRADFTMRGKNRKKGHITGMSGSIPLVTIDGISPPEGVGLLCLDIEGAEVPALEGALKVLHCQRPTLAVEVNIGRLRKGSNYTTTVAAILDIIPPGYVEVETYGLDRVFVYRGRP